MKVYCMNWDGRRERMVAAKNKKTAAAALGVTIYQFNLYAHETGNDDDIATAMGDVGAVFEKPFARNGVWRKVTVL